MATSLYPDVVRGRDDSESLDYIYDWIEEITSIRETEDISQFSNIPNLYLPGRSTGRVPSTPTDVVAADQEGDIVNDGTYEYKLVNVTGTGLRWDRRTLNISW